MNEDEELRKIRNMYKHFGKALAILKCCAKDDRVEVNRRHVLAVIKCAERDCGMELPPVRSFWWLPL